MKGTDDLFLLIHSMDKNEKGYFKKFAALDGKPNNNYVRLFDAIDQMDDYDERTIKLKFKNEKFVKQLNVTKGYLHETLRFALTTYHRKNNDNAKLYQILSQVDIMLRRNLFSECLSLIDKGEKLALQQQKYPILLQLYIYKQNVYSAQNRDAKDINELYQTINHIQDRMALLAKLQHVSLAIHQILRVSRFAPNAEQIAQADTMLAGINAAQIAKLNVFQLRLKYFEINANYAYFFSRSQDEATKLTEDILQVFEEHPNEKNKNASNYLRIMAGLTEYYVTQEKYPKALALVERMGREIYERKEHLAHKDYLQLNYLSFGSQRLQVLIRLRDWDEAFKCLVRHEVDIKEQMLSMPARSAGIFELYVAELLIYTNQPSLALDRVQKVLEVSDNGVDNEIHHYGKMLELIAHIDLKHTKLLDHMLLSFKRWCKKNEIATPDHKLFLDMVSGLIKALPDKTETQKTREKYYAVAEKHFAQPGHVQLLETFFDLLYWLKMKKG